MSIGTSCTTWLSLVLWLILFTAVEPCVAQTARIDPAIARQAAGVELEVLVSLVPDGPPRPFSRPTRIRTEEGRAWVRSTVATLRQQGVESVYELGDGIVWARIRSGNGMRIVGLLAQNPRVERIDLSPVWVGQTREGLDSAGIHDGATTQYLPEFSHGFLPTLGADVDVVVIDGAFDVNHPALFSQQGIQPIKTYCACGKAQLPGQPVVGCCPNDGVWQEQGSGLGLAPPGAHGFNVDFHGTAVASVIRSAVDMNVPLGSSHPLACPSQTPV